MANFPLAMRSSQALAFHSSNLGDNPLSLQAPFEAAHGRDAGKPAAGLFLGFLKHLHSRTAESKEANLLISPVIFDPNHPKAEGMTKRGLDNIVAMQHLWMDFENGDLRPEEIPELFPHVRLVVFNTYNHSQETRRFRVVVPFDEAISAADYTVLYDNVMAKMWMLGLAWESLNPASGLD